MQASLILVSDAPQTPHTCFLGAMRRLARGAGDTSRLPARRSLLGCAFQLLDFLTTFRGYLKTKSGIGSLMVLREGPFSGWS